MDESPDIDDEAETPAAGSVEQSAPAPPKRRGRPKGLPKTGGRQALPKTPADLRGYIVEQVGKADRLLDIAQGRQINLSGPSGKSYLGYPSIADQLAAWKLLLAKCLPDLQSVATTLDAKVDGEIRTPDAPPTRDLARAVLDILRTAQMEKVPHRGEYIEADEADDDEERVVHDGSYFNQSSAGLASRGSAESAGGVVEPPSASPNAAPGQPFPAARNEGAGRVGHAAHPSPSHSPAPDPATMSQAELRQELIRQGVLPADEPTHIPHNPFASKDEMPPPMSAEDRMAARAKEQGRHPLSGARRSPYSDDYLAGIPEGEHQRRPNADPDFEPSGLAKKHYCGERGHHYVYNGVENGDGRRRYLLFDEHGMRFGLAWGHDEAKAKIEEVTSRAPTKWQRN